MRTAAYRSGITFHRLGSRMREQNRMKKVVSLQICPTCRKRKDHRSFQCRACSQPAPKEKRRCTQCKKQKRLGEFRIRTRKTPRPRSVCKQCEASYTRSKWLSMPIEERRVRKAISRSKESPHLLRLQRMRARIRILDLQQETDRIMWDLHNVKSCRICGLVPTRSLHIDHSHVTKKYRGLLCDSCNLGLGHFKDSPDILLRAIAYIRKFEAA